MYCALASSVLRPRLFDLLRALAREAFWRQDSRKRPKAQNTTLQRAIDADVQDHRHAAHGVSAGSELFVVYSDGRDTVPKGFPQLLNRAFIVKMNRLSRF